MRSFASFALCLAMATQAATAQTQDPFIPVDEVSGEVSEAPVIAEPSQCETLLHSLGGDVAACAAVANAGGPGAARAHSALAAHAQRQGDLVLARRHIELALANSPADGTILNNFANLLLLEKDYAEALNNYAIALDDIALSRADVAAIHLNRALCLRALGRYDAAKDAYLAHKSWLADPLETMPPGS